MPSIDLLHIDTEGLTFNLFGDGARVRAPRKKFSEFLGRFLAKVAKVERSWEPYLAKVRHSQERALNCESG